MKGKNIVITILLCLIVAVVGIMEVVYQKVNTDAGSYYRVYLKGEDIGLISSSDELYALINRKQEQIRSKYGVENVYPPSDFEIVKTNTYDKSLSTVDAIYKKIEEVDNFTIKGYLITIKNPDEEKNITISVLDRKVFEQALDNFVSAFVDKDTYNNYINNTQDPIVDVGSIIDKMYFKESISIREGLVSVNNKIFTDVADLSQYLLFGENAEMQHYNVKMGDSLESIAENNKLNVQELLISNPSYRSENAILAVGDNLNVTYLNPIINLVEEIHKVEDVESTMETKVVYDNTKPVTYSEITTPGVTGITRMTQEYQKVNGEANSEVIVTNKVVIREPVTQVTTKGRAYTGNYISGQYFDTGLEWGWPTNSGYVITSYFTWRWGKHHDGIDISGTGEGSPIYAAANGVVIKSGWNAGGYGGGESVVIEHANGYFTMYAHMVGGSLRVKPGDRVVKGQIIGAMGHTGWATGTHLHYTVARGTTDHWGQQFIDPMSLYR